MNRTFTGRAAALLTLSTLLALGPVPDARADDEQPSVIVLKDGQTLEGIVRIEGPTVRIIVKNGAESAEIVLAAESVVSIDPRDKPDQVVEDAAVRLKDGRVLRGRAVRYKKLLRVQGTHGELEVAMDEVAGIGEAEEPRSRLLVDGDLGIALPLPKGWDGDEPTELGERLRAVDEGAQSFVSVLIRTLPEGDSNLAQVRAALQGDLSPRAQVTPRGDKLWVEDELRAPGSESVQIKRSGIVEVRDDVLVWVRVTTLASAPRDVREAAEALAKRVSWLEPGIHESAAIVYAPKQRLLLSAPSDTKLERPKKGPAYRIVARQEGGFLDVWFLENDADAAAALQDRLDADAVQETTVGNSKVFVLEREGLRALAYPVGQGSVLIVVKAKQPDLLARLALSARLLEPEAVLEEIARDTRIARQMSEIRAHLHEERAVQAEKITRELLDATPDSPDLLGLAVECRRAQKKSLSDDLDDLYSSLGSEWTARELSEALLEEGREMPAERYVEAADALERAAQVWPSEENAKEVQTFFVDGALAAYKAGERNVAWARLARARAVGADPAAVDATERDLRLEAADAYLKEKKPDLARREARKAYDLGADDGRVDRIYATAERIQVMLERAAKLTKRRSGGFQFGLPPTRTGSRQGRVRPTTFQRPSRRGRRTRPRFVRRGRRIRNRPQRVSRQRRVQPYLTSQGGSRRARVRSRARVLFTSRS